MRTIIQDVKADRQMLYTQKDVIELLEKQQQKCYHEAYRTISGVIREREKATNKLIIKLAEKASEADVSYTLTADAYEHGKYETYNNCITELKKINHD